MAATINRFTPLMGNVFRRLSQYHQLENHKSWQWLFKQRHVTTKRFSSNDGSSSWYQDTPSTETPSDVREGRLGDGIDNTAPGSPVDATDSFDPGGELHKSDSDISASMSLPGQDKETKESSCAGIPEDQTLPSTAEQTADQGTVTKKKKKAPISEMVKVIRHKKMLEIFHARQRRSRVSKVPVIGGNSGFQNQLQEYISRYDDTLESEDGSRQEFAVSKGGKVLMFPLSNCDVGSKDGLGNNIPEDTNEKLPSVTTILRVTKPLKQAMALLRWEKNMIKELGVDGFEQMKKEMFVEGHEIHRAVESNVRGTPAEELELSPAVQGYWQSCSEVIQRVSNPAGFEMKVTHPAMRYTGYLDCVAEFDGKTSLIEWKTSRKLKLDLKQNEDYPLQAVAYLGAMNFDPNHHNIQVEQIVIVVAYKDGHEATVHYLDKETCEVYWTQWLGRLLEYQEIQEMKKYYTKGKIIEWNKAKRAKERA